MLHPTSKRKELNKRARPIALSLYSLYLILRSISKIPFLFYTLFNSSISLLDFWNFGGDVFLLLIGVFMRNGHRSTRKLFFIGFPIMLLGDYLLWGSIPERFSTWLYVVGEGVIGTLLLSTRMVRRYIDAASVAEQSIKDVSPVLEESKSVVSVNDYLRELRAFTPPPPLPKAETPKPLQSVETPRPHQPLPSRFTHIKLLGTGASSKVYKAYDTQIQREVAVKVLNPHLHTDPTSLERFRREIQITRQIQHPQIITIYDLVEDGERIYMIMEYLEGIDLKGFVRLNSPTSPDVALNIIRQILEALRVAHSNRVIHRDLKPQNVIINADHQIKLIDFGVARMATQSDLTQTGVALGTPEYMAPELFVSRFYDPRTDLYACGIILFELLTGELPFHSDNMAALYHKHANEEAPDPQKKNVTLPNWISQLVQKLLAKKPYQRYQTSDEVLGDISNQSVSLIGLPEPKVRPCASCQKKTLVALPMCTYCGFSIWDSFALGEVSLKIAEGTDPTHLEQFSRRYFKTVPPWYKTFIDQFFIMNISPERAESLRTLARESKVILEVATYPPDWLAWTILGSLPLLVVPFLSVALGKKMALLLVWGVVVWRVVKRFIRHLPIIKRESLPEVPLPAWFKAKGLENLFRAQGCQDLKETVADLIGKHTILEQHHSLDGEDRRNLEVFFSTAASLINVMTEVRTKLAEAESLGLAGKGYAQEIAQLGDKYSNLVGVLVHVLSVYNSLLNRIIVLRLPFGEEHRSFLTDSIKTLKLEVEAGQELRRLAA